MSASGYTSNPPSGGGGGGPVSISDVTGLTAALADRATDAELTAGLATKSATGHGHVVADVTSLQAALDGKSATGHAHAIADVTSLQSALDGKSATGHTHVAANVTDLAEAVQDVVGAMVVAGSNVTATYDDGTGQLTLAAPGGGGGGAAPTFVRGKITSGNVVLGADASWTPVAGLTLAIPAVVGDNVNLALACLISHTDSSFYEVAVLVGGSPVRYASTLTSSPAGGNEGDPSMYPLAGGPLHPLSTFMDFEVESGDLSGGNVTFALMHLGSGGGQVYASTAFPFRWRARNDHQ